MSPTHEPPVREDTNGAASTDRETSGWPRFAILGAIALLALLAAVLLRDHLTFDALAENRERLIAFRDANYIGTLLAFAGIYVVIVAFSLPGATLATLTGGFLFATFPGVLYNVTAATIGASGLFLAARWGLGERLAARMERAGGAVRRIKAGIDENQWSMLFLIRLLPAVPFFVANLVPALVGVAFHRFVVTTFLGIIPGTLVFTSVGAGLGGVFARGEMPDLGLIFEPRIILPILGLSALAALPIILKALRGRKETTL
ncbi:TVP38/TMEM64 family protein [Profundibacterium mesophilum]|uniref:TVP38/TMEM64 family membrane protein n=1 Tax=Profundibacterium mesophilum KAUST100406-0324 TaxID=1037889 RepID=A0A921TDB9_9RHOB|nr:VTT domain-containing protein [Profundibacterium mesophilum]KAF0676171.1 SNARE associated golgi family protein domain containing protein [Profundibacterium mesophilum KAUST100406-0324]